MKDLRSCIDQISGLRYVVEEMHFNSSPGRMAMLATPWSVEMEAIEQRLDEVARYIGYLSDHEQQKGMQEVAIHLCELMNVSGSIETVRQPQVICSDIDLFEIKRLALIEEKVRRLAEQYHLEILQCHSLTEVVDILDIDGERLPSFYISDSYSTVLRSLRKQMERTSEETERDELAVQCAIEEDRVRKRLTEALHPYADQIEEALMALAQIDKLHAIAQWAVAHGCCRPKPIRSGESTLTDLIHPEVAYHLAERQDRFQPVTISYSDQPTLITGANMAGKSVLLASIGLAQCLMQFGCYVTAQQVQLVPVDEVIFSIGDDQDIKSGLSSYGAEMLRLNRIIESVKEGKQVLALIDEPARTTNPEEGHALVSALVQLFAQYAVRAIITTHYSGILGRCHRWRVRGFVEERLRKPLEINQLNRCIDYSLIYDTQTDAPHEALRIAEILGMDRELLDLCEKNLATKNEDK
ncbi:DNA mismatch repair protein MutS [Porphyromonas uenonis]|uniref:lysine 5,6-aminomutase reactivase ATPase KamC n=1 Tax=Porphyromonas uenonis TaxID=281920 RepID=UPI0026ED98B5|nr:DNA mismatch repair protein MutS [Porphyromonas uenonis]